MRGNSTWGYFYNAAVTTAQKLSEGIIFIQSKGKEGRLFNSIVSFPRISFSVFAFAFFRVHFLTLLAKGLLYTRCIPLMHVSLNIFHNSGHLLKQDTMHQGLLKPQQNKELRVSKKLWSHERLTESQTGVRLFVFAEIKKVSLRVQEWVWLDFSACIRSLYSPIYTLDHSTKMNEFW